MYAKFFSGKNTKCELINILNQIKVLASGANTHGSLADVEEINLTDNLSVHQTCLFILFI